MTKKEAIKYARSIVTLFPSINKQWDVRIFYPKDNIARSGAPTDYYKAKVRYSQYLIDVAREYLKKPPVQYDGGSWTSYI
jgi:hypothetical protein